MRRLQLANSRLAKLRLRSPIIMRIMPVTIMSARAASFVTVKTFCTSETKRTFMQLIKQRRTESGKLRSRVVDAAIRTHL